VLMLFATVLLHSSNGVSDVDSNQLITPEFTVTETGSYLVLYLYHKETFSLNVYILNELHHRLPNRRYSVEVVWNENNHATVSYCCVGFLKNAIASFSAIFGCAL